MQRAMIGLYLFLALNAFAQTQSPARVTMAQTAPRAAIAAPPERVVRHAAQLSAALKPTAKSWIEQQARVEAQRPTPDMTALHAAIQQRFAESLSQPRPGQPKMPATATSQSDIDALTMLVMMQATQDNEADLRSQMEQMQKENQRKQAQRQLLDELNREKAAMNASLSNEFCKTPFCNSLSSRVAALNASAGSAQPPIRMQPSSQITAQQLAALQDQLKQSLDSMNEMSEMTSMRLQMAMDRRSKFIEALSNIEKKISDTDAAIVQNMK
jgi:hypothetical protein